MIKDPILQKIAQQVSAKVPAQLRQAFQNAINDGLKIMHDQKTHQMMVDQLKQSPDMAENVGEGAAKLVGMLFRLGKGKLPLQVLIPAGVVLMCEALQFAADAGAVQITNETVAATYKAYMSALLQLLHITPEKLQQLTAQRAQGAQQQAQPQPQPQAPQGVIGSQMGA